MHPAIPLEPSGQAAGLFPGRGQGTPGDSLPPDAELTGQDSGLAGAIGYPGNAHVHVGCLVLGALIGVIAFHLLGFRFATDVSVGR